MQPQSKFRKQTKKIPMENYHFLQVKHYLCVHVFTVGSLNGIYGIKSLFPAPTGSVTLLYILFHGTRNISGILLLYRKLQFETLNVYRLKERAFKESILLLLPIEDGENRLER